MSGGPPSGRLLARLIAGAPPGIDPAPYDARRFAH
jgi:glycine/D-amino acid oxidase-like deaminating enzyme